MAKCAAAAKSLTLHITHAAVLTLRRLESRQIDILVHSLANGPEVQKPLMQVSRNGYLAASSASAYSMVSLTQVRQAARAVQR